MPTHGSQAKKSNDNKHCNNHPLDIYVHGKTAKPAVSGVVSSTALRIFPQLVCTCQQQPAVAMGHGDSGKCRQPASTDLRHVMKRHAKHKQSNACTHCNEPSARLRVHDLDPLYFVFSRSAPATTVITNATRTRISIEPSPPSGEKPK